ncbi:MAG: N5,N10-methylenetetrahydromethanopterin reductase-related protein Tbis family [Frankiales bacterium]|nr:N5,N10-methylenetetrahydromethanopterin reductase-related protein Tbis family [Frankiales bacterium]
MRIGVGLDGRLGLTFGELRDAGREAARLGFESAWTPSGTVPDAFHICAAWSQDSPPLRTGISVVPMARAWTALAVAIQAATVGQIADGRFVLGIGTGGYGADFWSSVGMPNRPIAVMRDYLTILRGLLNGEQVTYEGPALQVRGASLVAAADLSPVPLQLGALGPQMVRLAGELSDGALLNWATPERIALCRQWLNEGAVRGGRRTDEVKLTMYVRICVDDDIDAARQALATQVLAYAIGLPGGPQAARDAGYRAAFGAMGFEDVLTELEQRRDSGEPLGSLLKATPDELLNSVGYFGPAELAPAAYARLSEGLDETVVRVITARPGIESVIAVMQALTPARIRAAQESLR